LNNAPSYDSASQFGRADLPVSQKGSVAAPPCHADVPKSMWSASFAFRQP
jgi:hypothetical protein